MDKAKVTVIVGLWPLFLSVPAWAVPQLQLYSPEAEYHDTLTIDDGDHSFTITDSWFILDDEFTLDVVIDALPRRSSLSDVKLIVSVQEDFFDPAGWVELDGIRIEASDMTLGEPSPWGEAKDFPPHGIFPSYYAMIDVDDWESFPADIYDYNDSFDPDNPGHAEDGFIRSYEAAYCGFFHVHFDLTGVVTTTRRNGSETLEYVKAPFSHDADAPPSPPQPVPEPATLLLLGSGVLGLGFGRRRAGRSSK